MITVTQAVPVARTSTQTAYIGTRTAVSSAPIAGAAWGGYAAAAPAYTGWATGAPALAAWKKH